MPESRTAAERRVAPYLALMRMGRVANVKLRRRRVFTVLLSCFLCLEKSEAEGEQLVLLLHGPRTGNAEALVQPRNGFDAADREPYPVELAEATNLFGYSVAATRGMQATSWTYPSTAQLKLLLCEVNQIAAAKIVSVG